MKRTTLRRYAEMFREGRSPVMQGAPVIKPQETPGDSPGELPECLEAPSEHVAIGTDGDDSDIDLEGPARLPKITRSKLNVWRAHPNFGPGMRLAELATQWLVNGNSKNQWCAHMAWLRKSVPGSFGNINHSSWFLDRFLMSLVGTAHTCVSSSLHSIIPATGMPSMFSRIIDVVSIKGRSLLVHQWQRRACLGVDRNALLGA